MRQKCETCFNGEQGLGKMLFCIKPDASYATQKPTATDGGAICDRQQPGEYQHSEGLQLDMRLGVDLGYGSKAS